VSPSGTTSIYKSLEEAVQKAAAGSTVYLPGGGFTLQDTLKISKKLSIIGVGHMLSAGNADGFTSIDGNISFIGNSSESAIMGCYISGFIYIGKDGSAVEDVLIKYCNMSSINIWNKFCTGTIINQNYCRNSFLLGQTNAKVTNNIMGSVGQGDCAEISYNILTSSSYPFHAGTSGGSYENRNSKIAYNIVLASSSLWTGVGVYYGDQFIGNMAASPLSDDPNFIKATDAWKDVFVSFVSNSNPLNDFHFTEAYQQYEGQVGIYGGSGFSDSGIPPVPYISYKYVPDHTDAEGKLNIKIRVKASE
jgi:hypothetical protein